jgi:two-component system CheB/CheR fusion protein
MKTRKQAPVKAAPSEGKVVVPARAEPVAASFPIVGIGASAGGLAAFKAFFSGMPVDADPMMAFVLVQHLVPDHESLLTELVQRYTRMKVFQVTEGLVLQPNCVYAAPPGCDLVILSGALHPLDTTSPRGQRLPIDYFFRSLAQDQGERAIGIVLSGTASDGTLGVRTIKAAGGMIMVQTPETAEFDGMPRSAIATGLVDYELPPAEMPAKLIAYAALAFGQPPESSTASPPQLANARKRIFSLLRAQTGHDFTLYKPSTMDRRIERRMAIHQIDALDGYAKFLQQTPEEVEALFRELLVCVTDFFRDPEFFSVLETQVIGKLVADKPKGDPIRIWVPGCATGEEAYSIAILVVERMEALKVSFPVKVFATDLAAHSVITARVGHYPAGIAAHLSPERLAHFFTAEPAGGGYRVKKSLRDLVVFSEQDVIRDPPFSKLDLISCRNLLIYMRVELQQKLMAVFHFALRPGGTLFLGSSERV